MTLNLYPDELWEQIKYKKKYVPRKLRPGEKLRQYRRYWIPDYGMVKVKEVINLEEEYYSISYNNGTYYGVIPYPISNGCYELLKNFENVESKEFINKRYAIYGAEIKYWFLINNIDFNDENYSGFLDQLENLRDTTKYIVRRNKKKKEYEFIRK